MREILFRGKTDKGEWVQGDLLHPDLYGNGYSIEDFSKEKNNCFDVIPETVEQYTGLTDKNGKKVFEGDIVKIENRIYTVSFEKGCWVILGKSDFWDFLETNSRNCEIIGNIHDNPELLKGEAQL